MPSEDPILRVEQRTQSVLALRQFSKNRLALMGLLVVIGLVGVATLASHLAPYDPTEMNLEDALEAPGDAHWLGTDSYGRDVLTRVMYGSRVSLMVGMLAVGFALSVGVPVGLATGFYGGRLDDLLMRVTDAMLSFPPILLALVLMASLGQGVGSVVLAISVLYVPVFARLVRSSTLSVKENLYILAARSLGTPDWRIVFRHIFPNVVAPIIIQATLSFAGAIISEAGLSFLGMGVPPPMPSWGRDLNDARNYLSTASWLPIGPAVAIILSVLAINFAGDGLRDALDPRLRTSRRQ